MTNFEYNYLLSRLVRNKKQSRQLHLIFLKWKWKIYSYLFQFISTSSNVVIFHHRAKAKPTAPKKNEGLGGSLDYYAECYPGYNSSYALSTNFKCHFVILTRNTINLVPLKWKMAWLIVMRKPTTPKWTWYWNLTGTPYYWIRIYSYHIEYLIYVVS